METDPTLPDHTIFRPAKLATVKGKLPVIAFGNGGCVNIGNAFQTFLAEVASRGYVVAAPGPILANLNPFAPGQPRPPQSQLRQMLATLDWAAAECARKGSPYRGRLDLTRVAVMGEAAIAWLDWRLKGDAKAAKWFAGKDCGLCRDARWTVKARGLD